MFLSGLEKGRIFYFLCFQTLEAGAGTQLRLEKAGQTAKKGKNAQNPSFCKLTLHFLTILNNFFVSHLQICIGKFFLDTELKSNQL